MDLIKLIMTR